jgi:HPt (histidine-containing phosphotransfer) domain-containing protein
VDLSPTEFRLLQTVMERPNELVSTRALLQQVWGHQDMTARNVVRVTASRLRAKLEVDPAHPQFLQTVSGEGLIFRTDQRAARPVAAVAPAPPKLPDGPVALDVVAELRELMGQMGSQPLQHLVEVFLQSAQNHLEGMRSALSDGNAEELGREAHRLRGASASVGAQRVSAICGRIESRARTGDLSTIDAELEKLEHELKVFEAAIVPLLA